MDRSADKKSIMDYLPEQEKAKLKKLVERLAEETQEKQRYKKLYEQMCQKYAHLEQKCQEVETSNEDLRAQIAASRMAINKAKEAYIASKSARKIRRDEDQTRNGREEEPSIEVLKQTWLKIPKSAHKEQKQQKNMYVFEENQDEQPENQRMVRKLPPAPLRVEQKSLKKTIKTKGNQNSFQSSNKKEEILHLRKQIQSLAQQIQHKQRTELPLNQKIKKCEEIKRRYMKSQEKINSRKDCGSDQQEGYHQQQPKISPRYNHNTMSKSPNNSYEQQPSHIEIQRTNRTNSIKIEPQPPKHKPKSRAATYNTPEPAQSVVKTQANRRVHEPTRQTQIDESLFAIIDHLNR